MLIWFALPNLNSKMKIFLILIKSYEINIKNTDIIMPVLCLDKFPNGKDIFSKENIHSFNQVALEKSVIVFKINNIFSNTFNIIYFIFDLTLFQALHILI